MRVKMNRDLKAAFDGNTVQSLSAGKTFDVPPSFGKRWVEKGIASVPENKAKGPAPENKARPKSRSRRKKK